MFIYERLPALPIHVDALDVLGLIPDMLWNEENMQHMSIRDMLDAGYAHGGGWRPFFGFVIDDDKSMHYEGDPPYLPLVKGTCSREGVALYVYQHGWVMLEENGTQEVCRMD